jgi:hypothetical protein
LESYHPYLQPQKLSKINTFTVACPESLNSTYGTHRPLGVKILHVFCINEVVVNVLCNHNFFACIWYS